MLKYLVPMLLTSTSAFADPISATVALISTATVAATAGAAYIFGSALYHFAAVYALSELGKALAPDVPVQDRKTRGYEVAGVSPAAPHAVIYGRTKVGGVIVYKETTDNDKFLHMIIAIAGHEVDEIEEVYFDDAELGFAGKNAALNEVTSPSQYDGKAFVYRHLGTDDQLADPQLMAASAGKWTGSHTLSGVAYVYVKLEFDADAYPNGEPSISFVVRGKKLYYPTTQATTFSSNPALALRDYLTSDYGLNADADEIDDVSFAAAAAICDETVSLVAGGTETRYTVNGSFITDVTPQTIIDDLTRAMAGSMWYAQGKFRVKAGAYTSPVLALDEDDNRSNIQIKTRNSRRDGFNAVTGKYRGAETDWQMTDFRKVSSSEFLQTDNNQELVADISLPFTSTTTMAQRLAKIMLYRNREQLSLSGNFGIRAFKLQVGDIVTYSNTHLGFSNKTFEVTGWKFVPTGDGAVEVTLGLSEVSSSVYDAYADEKIFESNNTILANAFTVPTVGLTVAQDTRIINEHVISLIRATVSATEASRIDYVEVEYKLASETTYNQLGVGELGIFEAIDLENGLYDVRARAINTIGRKGTYTTTQFNLQAGLDAPQDVASISATVNGAMTILEWEAITNLDLSFYRIRHSIATTNAKFADATTSFEKVPRPATSVSVPARAGTYMIQAYDKLGIPSENFTSVVVPQASLNQYTTTNTATENPSFSGTKTGCSVADNKLRITNPDTAPTSATYTFANDINTGGVRQVYATGFVSNDRLNTGSGLWDDLTGNIDTLSGLWDNLTADPQFPDTNVVFYISSTDDDPSGSPTWSPYMPFKSGQFSGWAFRFKVELTSTSDEITPNIDQLYAKVEY
jgi:hypothetical protein